MDGLLSGVLPFVYSQGNRLKNKLTQVLTDPAGVIAQAAGQLQDNAREQSGLMAAAFGDQKRPFMPTDTNALAQAIQNAQAGPLSFAPAGIFAGVGAKTADMVNLAQAQARLKAGDDPARVWAETGWGKGPDGKWRFEIDDSKAKNLFTNPKVETLRDINGGEWISPSSFMQQYPDTNEALTMRLRNTMYTDRLTSDTPTLAAAYSHPDLLNAYPDMYRTKVAIKNDMPIGDGGYSGTRDVVVLSPLAGQQADSVLLHELQHAVQVREGFAPGGAPGDALSQPAAQRYFDNARRQFDGDPQALMRMAQHRAYMNLAGEAEARLAQARATMTPAQRRAQFPWSPDYFSGASGSPLEALIVPAN